MRKLSSIQVYAKLAQGLWIALCNVRENIGHDDSLPYQAAVFIHDRPNVPNDYQASFRKIGTVCNDGWGGPSLIQGLPGDSASETLLRKAKEAAAQHMIYWKGTPFGNYTLDTVLDIMAEGYVDIQKTHRGLKELRYYLDDERKGKKVMQEFSFPARY